MNLPNRPLAALLVLAAVSWHALAHVLPAWQTLHAQPGGARDFASYYYAVHAASRGEDPYDTRALTSLARDQHERRAVHPFLYPPPFLLAVAWALPLDLRTAYAAWFWLDVAWAALAALALWRWWRPLGPAVPVLIAALVAANTAMASNHLMGQANFPGLALSILAMLALERRRAGLAGALLGAACMLKMSPALLVLWWALRREWRAVAAACVTAAVLSMAALPLAGPEVQLGFYTRVLPTFGSGDYNGLRVPIDLFGNHSVPNLWATAFPGGSARVLSPTARAASALSAVALLAAMGWAFRGRRPDDVRRAAQFSAVCVAMLLIPVYTYEHHAVWALPAAVLASLALMRGWLHPAWAVALLPSLVMWCFELSWLKARWIELGETTAPALVVRELKFVALVVLFAAMVSLGARGPRAPLPRNPSEERHTARSGGARY